MKGKKLFFISCALLTTVQAFSQMKSGDNITVNEAVTDDLYVAGGTVTINAPVYGDLIVAGGTVIVNDTITQDILVAGGNISLNGYVGDDIRCAGGTIGLSNGVGGDLIATGGTISVDRNSVIDGDLLASGGEVTVDGKVKGEIKSAAGVFTLNGSVGKGLDCRGGKIAINGTVEGASILAASTIDLGTEALFKADVRYWNKQGALDFKNSLSGGKAIFDSSLEINDGKWHYLGFASLLMVLWYLGTALVMIMILQYLFGHIFKEAANTVKHASLKSLGLGFLFLIGMPMVIILAMVTVIGLPVGILLLIGYGTVLLLATVIVSLLAGNWINNTYYQETWGRGRMVLTAFGIFVVLKLASLTPFVGPLIMLMLACMAFGGILQNVKWRRSKTPASA
jgi:hypothetical protein